MSSESLEVVSTNFTETTNALQTKFKCCCICLARFRLQAAHLLHVSNKKGAALVEAAARIGIFGSPKYNRGGLHNGLLLCTKCYDYQTHNELVLLPSLAVLEHLHLRVEKAIEQQDLNFSFWQFLDEIETATPEPLWPWIKLFEVVPTGPLRIAALERNPYAVVFFDDFPVLRTRSTAEYPGNQTISVIDRLIGQWPLVLPGSTGNTIRICGTVPGLLPQQTSQLSIGSLTAADLFYQDKNVYWLIDIGLAPVLALALDTKMNLPEDHKTCFSALELFNSLEKLRLMKTKAKFWVLPSGSRMYGEHGNVDGGNAGGMDTEEGQDRIDGSGDRAGSSGGGQSGSGHPSSLGMTTDNGKVDRSFSDVAKGSIIRKRERDILVWLDSVHLDWPGNHATHRDLPSVVDFDNIKKDSFCESTSPQSKHTDSPDHIRSPSLLPVLTGSWDSMESFSDSTSTPSEDTRSSGGISVDSECDWMFSPHSSTNENAYLLKRVRLDQPVLEPNPVSS